MGFVARATSGDFGLPKTFWLFGALGNLVGVTCLASLGTAFEASPRIWMAPVVLAVSVAVVYYGLMVWISIWRAAVQYRGPTVWARLATVAGSLGVICTVPAAAMAIIV